MTAFIDAGGVQIVILIVLMALVAWGAKDGDPSGLD